MRVKKVGVFIPTGRKVWAHEHRVATILAQANHYVEFLLEGSLPTPDILVDNLIEYEIKSPRTASANSLEHLIKNGLKQCPNLIIDGSRTRIRDDKLLQFLVAQAKSRKQIKKLLFITKKGKIIDVLTMI